MSVLLIVEDNQMNMKLIEMALRRDDYRFLRASNGEEALEMTEREKPSLIIMDVQLPGISGLEVTRRLRCKAEYARIPILAVTANAMKEDEERALDAGCDMYITKPIDTRVLRQTVAEMVESYEQGKGRAVPGGSA